MKAIKLSLVCLTILLVSCQSEPPKILIVGDSISIGYTPHVKEILGDGAVVSHNKGNAEHTGTGLRKIEEWIGQDEWDIIQINWGLWDLAYRHENSNEQGKRDKVNGTVTFSPDEYQANLDSLVTIIKTISKAKLIFVSTSYVPEGEAGRYVKDALIYNKRAAEVMKKHKIPVNDIYDYSKVIHQDHSTGHNNVHYTKDGYALLAEKIVKGLSSRERRLRKISK